MKTKTIDEVCGNPPDTFKKFILAQKAELKRQETERKQRIRERHRKI